MLRLLRIGVSYSDALTMPLRVVALLSREDNFRLKKNADAAKKGKAMGVVDMMELA